MCEEVSVGVEVVLLEIDGEVGVVFEDGWG